MSRRHGVNEIGSRAMALALGFGALGCLALLAACGGKSMPGVEEKVLNIYSWSNYIAPDTVLVFERETGIQVRYDTYDNNEILEAKLLTGRTNYDIVIPTGDFFERQVQAGVFRPLDKTALPNSRNLDPDIMQRLALHDPGNRYAVPYLWSATGIGYNPALVDARVKPGARRSWALLLDPASAARLQDCGISILDAPSDVVSSVLIYLGRDANSHETGDIRAAFDALMKIRPFVRYIDSAQYIADLANGSLCLSLGWSGDVIQARARAQEAGTGNRVAFFVPDEGAVMTIDAMGIPADAPHPLNAQRWMNYLMRPKVIAGITNAVKYPNGNIASLSFVVPAIASDPAIYPTADIRARLRIHRAQALEYSRTITREWTRFRTGG